MTDHANELRRHARKIAHPAGDVPSVMLAAAEEIERLAARLEATESEALEQARLNGTGSEREAALMAKLEAAEKSDAESLAMYRKARDERDALRVELNEIRYGTAVAHDTIKALNARIEAAEKERDWHAERCEDAMNECAALRAKIEAMERQEPIAYMPLSTRAALEAGGTGVVWNCHDRGAADEPIYALPGAQPAWSSQAVLDITAERRRQIEVECWTPEHDDEHRAGEMAKAAACYALVSAGFNPDAAGSVWPWRRRWWKPSDKRRDLIKAGALILAEVERLDRAAEVGRKMK